MTAEAVIFLPLLYTAAYYSSPDVIPTAGIITGLTFGGLTLTALTTERDFSFLGGLLQAGGFVALGTIAASVLFGFNLGLFFTRLMILFAAGAILPGVEPVPQDGGIVGLRPGASARVAGR